MHRTKIWRKSEEISHGKILAGWAGLADLLLESIRWLLNITHEYGYDYCFTDIKEQLRVAACQIFAERISIVATSLTYTPFPALFSS